MRNGEKTKTKCRKRRARGVSDGGTDSASVASTLCVHFYSMRLMIMPTFENTKAASLSFLLVPSSCLGVTAHLVRLVLAQSLPLSHLLFIHSVQFQNTFSLRGMATIEMTV